MLPCAPAFLLTPGPAWCKGLPAVHFHTKLRLCKDVKDYARLSLQPVASHFHRICIDLFTVLEKTIDKNLSAISWEARKGDGKQLLGTVVSPKMAVSSQVKIHLILMSLHALGV